MTDTTDYGVPHPHSISSGMKYYVSAAAVVIYEAMNEPNTQLQILKEMLMNEGRSPNNVKWFNLEPFRSFLFDEEGRPKLKIRTHQGNHLLELSSYILE